MRERVLFSRGNSGETWVRAEILGIKYVTALTSESARIESERRRDRTKNCGGVRGMVVKKKRLDEGRRRKTRTIKGRSSSHRRQLLTLAVRLMYAATASDLDTTLAVRPQPSFYYLVRAGNELVELQQVEINERTLRGCWADGGFTEKASSVEKSRTVIGKTKE